MPIGMNDNTFVSGTFSPLFWGLPAFLLTGQMKAAPRSAPAIIVGSTAVATALYFQDSLREGSGFVSRGLTWRGM